MLVIRNTLEYTNALIAALEDMLDIIKGNYNQTALTGEQISKMESAEALITMLTRE